MTVNESRVTTSEQFQNRLRDLWGERERVDRQLLAGLQGQHIGALFVHIRQGEFIRALGQDINQVLGKVPPTGDDWVIITQLGRENALFKQETALSEDNAVKF